MKEDGPLSSKRRKFIVGLGATGLGVLGWRKWAKGDPIHDELKKFAAEEDKLTAAIRGREWLDGKKYLEIGAFVRSAEGQRVLHEGSDEEIENLILSLSGALQEEIAASDSDPVKKLPSFPSFRLGHMLGDGLVVERSVVAGDTKTAGNAFWIAEDIILTNQHVAPVVLDDAKQGQELYGGMRDGLDVEAMTFTEYSNFAKIADAPILAATNKTREELSGEFVVTAGIDADEMALSDGTKRFGSVAVPVTPRLLEFIKKRRWLGWGHQDFVSEGAEKTFANSFLILLHPGSWKYVHSNQHRSLASGMSGSPSLLSNGDVAGIIHAAMAVDIQNSPVGLGFFHDMPTVLSKMPEDLRQRIERS